MYKVEIISATELSGLRRNCNKKKNHTHPQKSNYKAASLLFAKGHKGIQQPEIIVQKQLDYMEEIDSVIEKEKSVGMMISIINKKRVNGTLECRHNPKDKWSSMRAYPESEEIKEKDGMRCQKCGFTVPIVSDNGCDSCSYRIGKRCDLFDKFRTDCLDYEEK